MTTDDCLEPAGWIAPRAETRAAGQANALGRSVPIGKRRDGGNA